MIYAVGTGRCGTKSYADQTGGLHEPDKVFGYLCMLYDLTGQRFTQLINMIRVRKDLATPCISDWKQSFVIDLIREFDKDAKFVWLLRNPISTIKSYMRRGKYEDIVRPGIAVKFPDEWGDFEKFCWLWKATNLLIEDNLKDADFEVVRTRTLSTHANKGRSNPIAWTDKMEEYYAKEIQPYWEYLHERYDPLRYEGV